MIAQNPSYVVVVPGQSESHKRPEAAEALPQVKRIKITPMRHPSGDSLSRPSSTGSEFSEFRRALTATPEPPQPAPQTFQLNNNNYTTPEPRPPIHSGQSSTVEGAATPLKILTPLEVNQKVSRDIKVLLMRQQHRLKFGFKIGGKGDVEFRELDLELKDSVRNTIKYKFHDQLKLLAPKALKEGRSLIELCQQLKAIFDDKVPETLLFLFNGRS